MNMMLEKEIAELRSQGVSLDALTAEEIERLVKACEKMAHPYSRDNIDAIGFAYELKDGTKLYKLTIGATCWLDEFAGRWWDVNSKQYFWAMVYALANAREEGAFIGLTSEGVAHTEITNFALKLRVNEDELLDGIESCINAPEAEKSKQPYVGVDWAGILQTLEAATGLPTAHWVWKHSADWAVKAYSRHINEIKLIRGERASRMRDELDRATSELAHLRAAIIQRTKGDVK